MIARLQEFAALVERMSNARKKYLRNNTKANLRALHLIEHDVDAQVKRISLDAKYRLQPPLEGKA